MNIHEYQAKQLFEKFGVASTRGGAATTTEEAMRVARSLGTNNLVVKAQIHAGGRGKGTFTSGFQGGVHLCKTAAVDSCMCVDAGPVAQGSIRICQVGFFRPSHPFGKWAVKAPRQTRGFFQAHS